MYKANELNQQTKPLIHQNHYRSRSNSRIDSYLIGYKTQKTLTPALLAVVCSQTYQALSQLTSSCCGGIYNYFYPELPTPAIQINSQETKKPKYPADHLLDEIFSTFRNDRNLVKVKKSKDPNSKLKVSVIKGEQDYKGFLSDHIFALQPYTLYDTETRHLKHHELKTKRQEDRRVKVALHLIKRQSYAVKIDTIRLLTSSLSNVEQEVIDFTEKLQKEYELTKITQPDSYKALRITLRRNSQHIKLTVKTYLFTPLYTALNPLPQSINKWLNIFDTLTDKLQEIHKKNIIHVDVKPENIIIASEKSAHFIDFGLSYKVNRRTKSSMHGLIKETNPAMTTAKGTRGFVAPEIFDSGTYSSYSDIYSLGKSFEEYLYNVRIELGQETLLLRKTRYPSQFYNLVIKNQQTLSKPIKFEVTPIGFADDCNLLFYKNLSYNILTDNSTSFAKRTPTDQFKVTRELAKTMICYDLAKQFMANNELEYRATLPQIKEVFKSMIDKPVILKRNLIKQLNFAIDYFLSFDYKLLNNAGHTLIDKIFQTATYSLISRKTRPAYLRAIKDVEYVGNQAFYGDTALTYSVKNEYLSSPNKAQFFSQYLIIAEQYTSHLRKKSHSKVLATVLYFEHMKNLTKSSSVKPKLIFRDITTTLRSTIDLLRKEPKNKKRVSY